VAEITKAYKILIGKPETKDPFAKSSLRCEDISKKDVKQKEKRDYLYSFTVHLLTIVTKSD
jgi:hypothetical protein